MKYYTIDPETGDKEKVGIKDSLGKWYYMVDPLTLRPDEKVVDEAGETYILSDLTKEAEHDRVD